MIYHLALSANCFLQHHTAVNMLIIVAASVSIVVGVMYVYHKNMKPPNPKICGTPDGPTVTSPRIKLGDGRHLAYRERGVPKQTAKNRVILVHGFDSSKDIYLPLSQVRMLFGITEMYSFQLDKCDMN